MSRMQYKGKNRDKHKRRREHRYNRQIVGGHYPPPIKSQPIQTRSLRYLGTGSAGTTVNFNLLDLLVSLSCATTTTTYTTLLGAVKLNRITLSVIPGITLTGTVTFGWKGSRTPVEETTFYYGADQPARMSFVPPPESLADFWFRGDTNGTDTVETVWTINNSGTANIIMDLHFDYILMDGLGWGNACVTTTAGNVFAPSLPRGGVLFVPVGLTHTSVT